jgi:trehalose 6-phosphate phosphatase
MPVAYPVPSRTALLLDLDGTLLDFAASPMEVVVPPALPDSLLRLRSKLEGALAVITGRPIAQIDALLPGIPTAVAGEHGAAFRFRPDADTSFADAFPVPASVRQTAQSLAAEFPGAVYEPKSHGFVLHFRNAPLAGPVFRQWIEAAVSQENEGWPEEKARFAVVAAKMAWEWRPAGVNKGAALQRLMEAPPFQGRVPVFIGDDVTDFDAIRAANACGGAGYLVGEDFRDPADVRAWLQDWASA